MSSFGSMNTTITSSSKRDEEEEEKPTSHFYEELVDVYYELYEKESEE